MIPAHIDAYAFRMDGHDFVNGATEVKLPKLARKTEDFRNGAIDGVRKIDVGQEAMEMEITLKGHDKDALGLWGVMNGQGFTFQIFANLDDDNGLDTPVVIRGRGSVDEWDPDNLKSDEVGTVKLKISLTMFSYSEGGEEVVHIDVDQMVRSINGVDQLEKKRANIGV